MQDLPLEVSVEEVKARLDRAEPLFLLDVREPEEFHFSRMEGAQLIPMGSIPQNLNHLEDRDETIVVICHHGVRSLNVAAWLRQKGVESVQSMAGGIDAWSRRIDPLIPRY